MPFSAVPHVYLRIAHDASADRVLCQTAAGDGMSWTTQASVGRQLNVTAMRMELKAEHRRSRSPTRAPSRSTTSR